jgi:hypothetical protein
VTLVLITDLSAKLVLGKTRTEPQCVLLVLAIVPCNCGRPDYPDIYQAMTSVDTMARNIGTLIVVILKAVRR